MTTFKFNLLPKKSENEILREQKRDSYAIYYSLLILVAVLMWLGLLLFNNYVVDSKRTQWSESNQKKIDKIENEYRDVRELHGELVMKTNSLEPLLDKDVDPEVVFLVAEQVFQAGEQGVDIVGYGRNDDGSFSISVAADDEQLVSKKARSLKNLDIVENLKVDTINFSQSANQLIANFTFEVDTALL